MTNDQIHCRRKLCPRLDKDQMERKRKTKSSSSLRCWSAGWCSEYRRDFTESTFILFIVNDLCNRKDRAERWSKILFHREYSPLLDQINEWSDLRRGGEDFSWIWKKIPFVFCSGVCWRYCISNGKERVVDENEFTEMKLSGELFRRWIVLDQVSHRGFGRSPKWKRERKKDPSSHLTNNSFFFEFLDEKWSVESDRWSIELRSMEKCHQWRFFPLRGRVVLFVGILSSSSQIRPIGRRNSSRKSFLKDIFIANEENLRRYSKDSISRYCPGKIVNQSEEEEENFSSEKIVPFNLLLSKWQWRRNVSSSMDSTLLFKWKQSQSDNGGDMKRCVSRKNEVGRRREEEILSSNWQIERKENWFDEELSSMRKWKNWMKTSNARLWTRLALSRRNDSLKP